MKTKSSIKKLEIKNVIGLNKSKTNLFTDKSNPQICKNTKARSIDYNPKNSF